MGMWYGESQPTNNTAEIQALVDALEWVSSVHPRTLAVHGDSKLAIDFCRRVARPSRPELFVNIRRV